MRSTTVVDFTAGFGISTRTVSGADPGMRATARYFTPGCTGYCGEKTNAILSQHRRHIRGVDKNLEDVTIAFRRQLSSARPVLEQKEISGAVEADHRSLNEKEKARGEGAAWHKRQQ